MIILASKSQIRSHLLSQAGLQHVVEASAYDEAALQNKIPAYPSDVLATILADAKALDVGTKHPNDYVIGADQTLEFQNRTIHKCRDLTSARHMLENLSGNRHSLHSAVTVVKHHHVQFQFKTQAQLTMRHLSPEFLDHYLAKSGQDLLTTVGCYKLEASGLQLFEKIEGDYFTILGLPLLPLLQFFRKVGELPS
jgi:septum formation protein